MERESGGDRAGKWGGRSRAPAHAGPVAVWRLGGSRGPPRIARGHRGLGAHCALRGSPDLAASWGPVRPAERLLLPKKLHPGRWDLWPLPLPRPWIPGAFWHLPTTTTYASLSSPSSLSLVPTLHLSVSLPLPFLSFFACLLLSFLSLSLLSFKISPPCENNASSLLKSQKSREKKVKLTRCSLWVGTFKFASSWPSHLYRD